MVVKDLIFKYEPETIINRLIALYPDSDKESYLHAIAELKSLKPKKTTMSIAVYEYGDVDEKRDYVRVNGIGTDEGEYHDNWALDFTDWREILSMKITQSSINYFSLLDVVCYILWEITFNGYSNKEIQEQLQDLKKIIRDIKKKGE